MMEFLYGKRNDTAAQSPNNNSQTNSGKPTSRNSPTGSISSTNRSAQKSSNSNQQQTASQSAYNNTQSSTKAKNIEASQQSIFTMSKDSKSGTATQSMSSQKGLHTQNQAIAGAYSNIMTSIGLQGRNNSPKNQTGIEVPTRKSTKNSERLFPSEPIQTKSSVNNNANMNSQMFYGAKGSNQYIQSQSLSSNNMSKNQYGQPKQYNPTATPQHKNIDIISQQMGIETTKYKRRSNSPQSNTSSLIDTTSFTDTSLNKVNVQYPQKSPKTSSRRVLNINKDNENVYEEMKVDGTIESSDEDDMMQNPFDISSKDLQSKAGQMSYNNTIPKMPAQSPVNNQSSDRYSMPKEQGSKVNFVSPKTQTTNNRHTQGGSTSNNQNQSTENYKKKVIQYLIDAAETGNTDSVQDALNKQKYGQFTADINSHNKEDWTTLHFAVSEGHFNIAQMVLENNADVNALTAAKRTPLHIACIRGRPDYSKLLLIKGANVNLQDIDGNTPLHYASEYGHKDILIQLLQKNANIKIKNNLGKSPLDVSSSNRIFNIQQQQEEVKQIDNSPNPKNFQFARNAMHNNQNRVVIHNLNQQQSDGQMKQSATGEDNSQLQESVTNNNNNTQATSGQKPYNKQNSNNLNQSTKVGDNERQNTGSSQTSAGEYFLDNESSNPDIQQQEEKISTSSFHAIQLLGKGSFGEVYLVQKKSNSQYYAMKVLSKSKIMGQNLVRYAKTERNVLSYTQHPFIVNLNYAFQTSDKLFLILDYCPGGDMARVLQRERRFSEDRARIYIAEIVLAIQYLHKRDIIFRDLKPDNVVIDSEGHALLTDFGLSKEGVLDNISANSFCGSVAYLAPEMLKRSGHGKSVDWYLLGVLLYEMLVGQPPYFCNNKEQLFYNIQKGVLKLPASISHEAKSLLISLLNRNPNKRLGAAPTDAEEIKKHPFFDGIDWDRIIRRDYEVPKPNIRQIVQQEINPSIFEDIPLNIDGVNNNNIPGWSFVNPLENKEQMIEINVNDQTQKISQN
ncbi:protein kinase domain containing protein [Stylonychia lemnae]|uniref:non-specific serine/threonine protein kinase n=1 Tax=Stylonychia lemnae TaxID=5949 RepID=A0A077ZXI1_STYLE|nr:protein kinase domain containing protein [Stylonychia lemnae]|eukprot:CDW74610.1 protein kinase domain containing protein [Stylonychia lemnae]